MEIDPTNIGALISDLAEIEKGLDLAKRRIQMIRRDLLIKIGEKKPVVEKITHYTAPDGRKLDLSRYRK